VPPICRRGSSEHVAQGTTHAGSQSPGGATHLPPRLRSARGARHHTRRLTEPWRCSPSAATAHQSTRRKSSEKIDSSPQRCPQRPRSLVLQLSVDTQSTTTQLKLNMPLDSQSRSPPLGGLTLWSIPIPKEVLDNIVNSYRCTSLLQIPRDSLPCPADKYYKPIIHN
jgi:hypothetical protein